MGGDLVVLLLGLDQTRYIVTPFPGLTLKVLDQCWGRGFP